MHSKEWMPEKVRNKYDGLRQEAQTLGNTGTGVCVGPQGQPRYLWPGVAKPKRSTGPSPSKKAHNLMKQTFNVCFFKAFGSKQLFWHLVKVGPETNDLTELLRVWTDAKACPQYESLKQASNRKSDAEADLKRRLSSCKRQVSNLRLFHFEDEHSPLYVTTTSLWDDAVAAYEDAKKEWAALDRSTRSKGMHQLLDEFEDS
jgi:hypothetical protein